MISDNERQRRFARTFIKKVKGESTASGASGSFPAPKHKLGKDISDSDIISISSTRNSPIGYPLALFEAENALMITTTGIFFESISEKKSFAWAELDFVVSQNTAFDDFTFTLETSELLLRLYLKDFASKKAKKIVDWVIRFLILFLFLIFSILYYYMFSATWPNILLAYIVILLCSAFFVLPFERNLYVKINKVVLNNLVRVVAVLPNVLRIRPHSCFIHIGPTNHAEHIIACIMLGVEIYRGQVAKYCL